MYAATRQPNMKWVAEHHCPHAGDSFARGHGIFEKEGPRGECLVFLP